MAEGWASIHSVSPPRNSPILPHSSLRGRSGLGPSVPGDPMERHHHGTYSEAGVPLGRGGGHQPGGGFWAPSASVTLCWAPSPSQGHGCGVPFPAGTSSPWSLAGHQPLAAPPPLPPGWFRPPHGDAHLWVPTSPCHCHRAPPGPVEWGRHWEPREGAAAAVE